MIFIFQRNFNGFLKRMERGGVKILEKGVT